ncbi:MAG TPA: hypothetical protein VMS98_08435 [Thermoanaerobaculia bacterium]|nr:hypothetical protein [Thermoanaerobaculia bacterium]
MDGSPQLGSIELFAAGGETFTVDDAIASAMFRGGLDGAIDETLAMANAEDALEDVEPADADLQASSEKFRYEHDLISAGETEEWLEARGLTTGDFGAWLYQRLCGQMAPRLAASAVPDEFADLLRIHLWLSGGMDDLAGALRRRVAAGIETSDAPDGGVMAKFLARHRLDDDGVEEWLSALARDRSWLTQTVRREAAFERLSAEAASEAARGRTLGSMVMSLARVEMDTLALGSEAAAREAVLCVHDDGLSLSEVALETGYRAERTMLWMDEVEEQVAHRVLPAVAGDVIGPIERSGRFEVLQVLRKLPPLLTDPAVVRRVDSVIVNEFFDELCARHIHK